MKKKIIIVGLIILIIAAIGGKENKKHNNNKIIKIPNGIQVISHQKKEYATIETIIKNNTGKELSFIKITAECYDKDKNNLGKYSSGKYNINTTEQYKIEMYCPIETDTYKLYIETQ